MEQILRATATSAESTGRSSVLTDWMSTVGQDEIEGWKCDGGHWRMRTVGLCLGLLHECSLREAHFVRLVWASPHPLTLLGTEGNRLSSIPVQVQRLASVLAVHPAGPPLSIIANYIRIKNTPSSTICCSPPIPVLALGILNHMSITGHEIPLLTEAQESYLQSCCVEGLLTTGNEEDNGILSSLILIPFGADTPASNNLSIDEYNDIKSFQNTLSSEIAISTKLGIIGMDNQQLSSSKKGVHSLRDVVLQLLLTSITSSPIDGRNLSIRLLGLTDVVNRRLSGQSYHNILADISIEKLPLNCLEAIIYLLNSNRPTQISEVDSVSNDDDMLDRLPLIFHAPEQAMKCYELLYLLCSSPVTSSIVLTWLRHNNINFVHKQLKLCFDLTENVLELMSNNISVLRNVEMDLDRFLRSIVQCQAWCLKLCALDVYSVVKSSGNKSYLTSIVRTLFSSSLIKTFSTRQKKGSTPVSALISLLNNLPVTNPPDLSVNSNAITAIMSECCRPCNFVSMYGSNSTTVGTVRRSGFTVIDIPLFRSVLMVQDEAKVSAGYPPMSREELTSYIQKCNAFNSYSLLCLAESQLCEGCALVFAAAFHGNGTMLTMTGGSRDNPEEFDDGVNITIDTFILPLIKILDNAIGNNTWQAEHLARGLLSCISYLRKYEKFINISQFENLLKYLVNTVTRRGGQVESSPANASATVRGILSGCIVHLLSDNVSVIDDYSAGGDGLAEDPRLIVTQRRIEKKKISIQVCYFLNFIIEYFLALNIYFNILFIYFAIIYSDTFLYSYISC